MMGNKAWMPNSVTLFNLVLGFIAIIVIIREEFVIAAFLIFLCMILDGIDGRLARKLATHNPIGKDLDSLADLVSFGVVPALLLYQMYLVDLGAIGISVAALVPVCGAIRLAKFNTMSKKATLDYFSGLPITAAGGVLISFVLAKVTLSSNMVLILLLLMSYLMVSTIKYPNFKRITPFQTKFIVLYLASCFLISIDNLNSILMVILMGYVFLGLFLHIMPIPKLTRLFYTQ